MSSKAKEEFLKLLDTDVEFRYAVAGYLGLSEILKRLDKLEDGQLKLWESNTKLWEEVKAIREEDAKRFEALELSHKRLSENQEKLWEEVKALRVGQERLWENQEKLWEEVKFLRVNQEKLWEEVKALRESQEKLWVGQEKLWEEVRALRIDQRRVAVTLEKLTLSAEDEAHDVLKIRLKEELGLDIALGRIFVDEKEINIYGASDDVCVIGEVTVRLGTNLLEELEGKLLLIRQKRPELLRPRLIKVVYADYASPSALKMATEQKVWVTKWSGNITPLIIQELRA